MIDIYSDNVTEPTSMMRESMVHALEKEFLDKDTTSRLEELAADIVGKEAALFMPTATLANLVAILSQTNRGNEVIMGPDSHIYESEYGGVGLVGGMMVKTWQAKGTPSIGALEQACNPEFRYINGAHPQPGIVCFENVHNSSGGEVISPSYMQELCTVARLTIPKIHLDGARIFNAAAAMNTTARELSKEVDTIVFSLDKCLSAPYGALLCGPRSVISQAKKWQRLLGGFARKTSVLAAAGIVALEKMIDRVGEDNARARSIGEQLMEIDGLRVDPYPVPSNLVMLKVDRYAIDPIQFLKVLEKKYGVRAHIFGRHVIRLAIHRHIGIEEERIIVGSIKELVQSFKNNEVLDVD